MEAGKFYDLTPPSVINGKEYHRVQCEYQVPNKPNEYVVQGIPKGETEPKSFVLIFTDRGVITTLAREQNFGQDADQTDRRPHLRVLN